MGEVALPKNEPSYWISFVKSSAPKPFIHKKVDPASCIYKFMDNYACTHTIPATIKGNRAINVRRSYKLSEEGS